MEKEILNVLQSIDIKLGDIRNAICKPCEEKCSCEEEVEELKLEDEEEKIINFLKGLTEELGLKDHVVIRKVTIK